MTTAQSPLNYLKRQADAIAKSLKAIERGEMVASDPAGKLAAARERDGLSIALVMDDKVLKIDLAWAKIKDTSEAGISEFIVKHMRESRETVQ
jgi:hypothetical protein